MKLNIKTIPGFEKVLLSSRICHWRHLKSSQQSSQQQRRYKFEADEDDRLLNYFSAALKKI